MKIYAMASDHNMLMLFPFISQVPFIPNGEKSKCMSYSM